MAKWQRNPDGSWTPRDTAAADSGQTAPQSRGIDGAPNYAIRNGEWKRDAKLRRFDKPNDSQIRSLMQEDEAKRKKEMDTEPLIRQTKKDLESGKIRVHPGVLSDINKRVLPHAAEVDGRGVTHIVPIEKLTPEKYAEVKGTITPEVTAEVKPPSEGSLGGDSFGTVIERSLTRAKLEGRDNLRGKTF